MVGSMTVGERAPRSKTAPGYLIAELVAGGCRHARRIWFGIGAEVAGNGWGLRAAAVNLCFY